MARVLVAAFLVIAACDKGLTTRLYTDDEIAAIEAKASQRASRNPDAHMDVSTLSLRGVMKTLEDIRKEPDTSLALSRAIEQLLEVRRLGEGEQTLVRVVVVQSGEGAIADAVDEILRRGRPPATTLDALAAELDRIIMTEPRIGPAVEGDLRWVRGSILYDKFTPSGGSHDPRDERALTLAMLDEIEPLLASACPPVASLSACHRGLPARTKQLLLPYAFLDEAVDQIRASDASTRRRLQSELTHKVAMNQLGAYPLYVERAAARVSRLVALRVQIELLRDKTCHVPMDLLSPDVLGEPVRLSTLDHSLHIEPPAWATTGNLGVESWTIACP